MVAGRREGFLEAAAREAANLLVRASLCSGVAPLDALAGLAGPAATLARPAPLAGEDSLTGEPLMDAALLPREESLSLSSSA